MNKLGITLLSGILMISGLSFAGTAEAFGKKNKSRSEISLMKKGTNYKVHSKKRRVFEGRTVEKNAEVKSLNPKRRNWNFASTQQNQGVEKSAYVNPKRAHQNRLIEKHRTDAGSPQAYTVQRKRTHR